MGNEISQVFLGYRFAVHISTQIRLLSIVQQTVVGIYCKLVTNILTNLARKHWALFSENWEVSNLFEIFILGVLSFHFYL
jgi:hypothetical protein